MGTQTIRILSCYCRCRDDQRCCPGTPYDTATAQLPNENAGRRIAGFPVFARKQAGTADRSRQNPLRTGRKSSDALRPYQTRGNKICQAATLHIGMTPSTVSLMSDYLLRFAKKYPQIRFDVHESSTFTLKDQLENRQIDVTTLPEIYALCL